jgi:hypothetical protein
MQRSDMGKFFLHYLYFGASYVHGAGGVGKRDNPGQ